MTDIYATPQASLEQQAGGQDDDTRKMIFVGKNYVYYKRKWGEADLTKKQAGINWAAFFFGMAWMAYRKMYTYCGIWIAVVIPLTLLEIALDVPEMFSNVTTIAISVVVGLFGNYWYRLHVEKKIRLITSSLPPEQAQTELARQGGTSVGAVILFFACVFAAVAVMVALDTPVY